MMVIGLVGFGYPVAAETDSLRLGSTVEITLADHDILRGFVVAQDSLSITIETANELTIRIPRSRIKVTVIAAGDGSFTGYQFADPNDSRMYFGPTARTLPAGQGYIADYYVFFPFIGYGLTDYLTLAGGVSLLPGAETQIFYLAPKVRLIKQGQFDAGAGVLYFNSFDGKVNHAGVAYGITTYGSADHSLSFGAGWGFADGKIRHKPIFMVGGETRLSNSFKLLSENWIPLEADVVLLSLGIRAFGKNLAADLALIYPAGADMSGFPFFPWIDFVYNFGGR
jgi:hypothetical protein